MPIHDWTRVPPGAFHDFHVAWIAELRRTLNAQVLPQGYYAQAEQIIGPLGPDVLTLQDATIPAVASTPETASPGGLALATTPPQTRIHSRAEANAYARKRNHLVIRHSSGDRIIAFIEIVSSGNKASQREFHAFLDKACTALHAGYHLLIVDLFPPTPRDPGGMHDALWQEWCGEMAPHPPGEPLTLAAYMAGPPCEAFVEPASVGHTLRDMPLFLSPAQYVNVPLEATYQAAFEGVPNRWRVVLEG